MKKLFSIGVLFLIFISSIYAVAPPKDSLKLDKKLRQAEVYLENGNFKAAIPLYEELIQQDPNNGIYNFYLGYCYLNTANEQDRATKYLKKSVQYVPDDAEREQYIQGIKRATALENPPLETYYFLGRAYHVNYKFQEAIDVYNELSPKIPKNADQFKSAVKKEIEECKSGIELTKHSIEMKVTNLSPLNSEFSEHSPVVSADEKTLIFTSRRAGNLGKEASDGQFNEDIYITQKDNEGNWSAPQAIGTTINTKENEATIALSVDGKTLFIYKDRKGNPDIYQSTTTNGTNWTEPEILDENINSKYRESHASLSADGQLLYFCSDRRKQKAEGKLFKKKIGKGGMDLYVSRKLPDGTWGLPENLGALNTPHDEEGVFVQADGTLFFSSKGHSTMGGYDIFRVKKNNDGTWATPENLGYPINTTDDDVFYVVSPSGLRSYYASDQQHNDSHGETDIYLIGFGDENYRSFAVLKQNILLCDEKPSDLVKVTVYDPETDEIVGIYQPESDSGEIVMVLGPKSQYNVSYEADKYETVIDSFSIDGESAYNITRKEIMLGAVTLCKGADTYDFLVNNIKFDLNKDNINREKESVIYDNLDSFAEFLKQNPNIKIEIDGHCCERGTDKYNMGLSKRRADFARNYLIKQGVNKDNITINYYGFHRPIAINRNPDGSWKEESMQFNRRVEFIVLETGEVKIKVNQLAVPEKFLLK